MSTSWVWIAIAVYIAIGLAVAFVARRNLSAGTEEFYLGGRKITGLVSAASYAATTYSTSVSYTHLTLPTIYPV